VNVLDKKPRHVQPLPEGLTQTRYARFLVAPENMVRTVYDRVNERLKRSDEAWRKNRYWEGDLT